MKRGLLAIVGPGLLIAATGVGAGDLATAGFAGSRLGTTVLWAVVLGAALKFVMTEGLARWQLSSGTSLLEGVAHRLSPALLIVFLAYLIPWSFFVGGALISACGVTSHALLPVFDSAETAKLVFGGGLSAAAVVVAWVGGFAVFERLMAGCIVIMVASVLVTAVMAGIDLPAVASGIVWPRLSAPGTEGFDWTVALLGGVGGTVTLLCYGDWIRAAGRTRVDDVRTCRIDLAVGYAFTAIFGLAMVIIAARLGEVDGKSVGLIVAIADQLGEQLGRAGRLIFLIGAWAAMVSSLLGVWQAVPRIFGDAIRLVGFQRHQRRAERIFLVALAVLPMLQAARPFATAQKYYAIMGACFLPMLALVLLVLNGRCAPRPHRNSLATNIVLIATLALFAWLGARTIISKF